MKCFKALLAFSLLTALAIQADDKCGCSKPKPPRPPQNQPAPARKGTKVAAAAKLTKDAKKAEATRA